MLVKPQPSWSPSWQYQPPDVWMEASPDDSRLHASPSKGKLFLLCPAWIHDPFKLWERMKSLLLGGDCFATKVTVRTSVGSATSKVCIWLFHWTYTCTQGHHLQKSSLIWLQKNSALLSHILVRLNSFLLLHINSIFSLGLFMVHIHCSFTFWKLCASIHNLCGFLM